MASPDEQPIMSCHVVAMPYPGRGHINPMLNLCSAVAERSTAVLITVVVTEEWLGLIGSMKKPPNMTFAAIPNVLPSEKVRGYDVLAFAAAALTKLEEPFVRLLDGGGIRPPDFIIGDALMPWLSEVAGRRNIPVAHLWTMSASVYSVFYHIDLLVQNAHFPVDLSVNGEVVVDYIPGLSPIRLADLPPIMRDKESLPMLLKVMPNESKSNFLVFTSIYELESHVFEALKQKSLFKIFNIGPASAYFKLREIKSTNNGDTTSNYLQWLDLQPASSVLYVSLGSFLHIAMAQMDEIAVGLHASGVRFLWVARRETSRLQEMSGRDRGLVVEWCDQLRVLSHPSIGGFMSHCGWNSTKETVLAGVPVLTFPITFDQVPDAKAIVEDWRIGWRVLQQEFDEKNLKKGEEIGELMKRFMDLESEERKELNRNARESQMISEREFTSGESYQINLDGFVSAIHSSSLKT
ncbi:hypothetical protein ACS0TY_006753 [Phlomoides rotata]